MKQFSLIAASPNCHGGELALGKRKGIRPLSSKRPLHLVLKAGAPIRKHNSFIEAVAKRLAEKFSCRLYDVAIAEDHVHLVLKIPGRREYAAFVRSLTGLIARKIGPGLFRLLPFTRVANWGKDFRSLKSYLRKKREEAAGIRTYEPRRDWYRRRKIKF